MKIKDKVNALYYQLIVINIKIKWIELYMDVSKKLN